MIIFRTYKFRVRNFINTNNIIKLYYYLLSQRSTIPQFQNQNLTCCQLHHETIMKLVLAVILYFNYLTIKFIFTNFIPYLFYFNKFIQNYIIWNYFFKFIYCIFWTFWNMAFCYSRITTKIIANSMVKK